jgi:hypothetical protein
MQDRLTDANRNGQSKKGRGARASGWPDKGRTRRTSSKFLGGAQIRPIQKASALMQLNTLPFHLTNDYEHLQIRPKAHRSKVLSCGPGFVKENV